MALRPGLWASALLLLLPPGAGAVELSDEAKIGLIVGCSLGGLILLVLIVFLCCLTCRSGKRSASGSSSGGEYYAGKKGPESVLSSLAGGVWTTSPSMFAGAPSQAYVYANGAGPPKQDVFVSEPHLTQQPWIQRTVRRAKSMLQTIPAVFQVQKPAEKAAAPASELSRSLPAVQEEGRPVDIASGGPVATAPGGRVDPAPVDLAAGPHVAKAYSDYRLEAEDEAVDEDGLPVPQFSRPAVVARAQGGVTRSHSALPVSRPPSTGAYLRSPSDAHIFAYKRKEHLDRQRHSQQRQHQQPPPPRAPGSPTRAASDYVDIIRSAPQPAQQPAQQPIYAVPNKPSKPRAQASPPARPAPTPPRPAPTPPRPAPSPPRAASPRPSAPHWASSHLVPTPPPPPRQPLAAPADVSLDADEVTSSAFEFLDKYSADGYMEQEPARPRRDTLKRSEDVTEDAFRFLDDLDGASVGEGRLGRHEHLNY